MPRWETMNKKLKNSDQVDFRTPHYLFKFINSIYEIQFDAACKAGINNLAEPLRLEDKWPPGVVYSNPPFDMDSINSWIEKGYEHSRGAEGNVSIILIPNKITQVSFHDKSSNKFDSMIILGGRVNFDSIYSTKGGSSRNGSIILIQKRGESGIIFKKLKDIKEEFN